MRRLAGVCAGLALAAAVAGAGDAAGGFSKNERWGFKVRAPDGWTSVALPASEEWIALKHLGKRDLCPKDQYWGEKPEMWVVGFPHARQDERGVKVETKGTDEIEITVRHPYRDFKDFLSREQQFVGGGYYISEEKEGEVDGKKVTMYEVKVDKNTRADAPYRIVAWVYHFDDIDFAVQFKILEEHYEDYKPGFLSCLKSFRRVARTEALPGSTQTGADKIVEMENEKSLTPEQKRQRRQEAAQRMIQRELEALPKGWYKVETANYVILANADRKYAQAVADHAEAVRGYLEKTFPNIGYDYVPKGLIRVFASSDEQNAYAQTTGGFWVWIEQVLVAQEAGEYKSWALESMSWMLTRQWLSFKNRNLSWNMPFWVSMGLTQHMSNARSKGKRVEIKPDAHERHHLKEFLKKGDAVPLRTLLEGDEEVFRTKWESTYQAGSVVSFLLDKGNRGCTKDCIRNYLAALVVAVSEAEAEYEALKEKHKQEAAAAQGGGASEEDDDAEDADEKAWKELEAALKEKTKSIKQTAFAKAFGHLSDADWQRLDSQWREFAGG